MSIVAKIIWSLVALAITGGLLGYAAKGQGLTANGKKLVRVVAAIVFVMIALVVIFEETL